MKNYREKELFFTKLQIQFQDFHVFKPRLNFLRNLPPAFQKDNFLLRVYNIYRIEYCSMQLLVAEWLEK